MSQEKDFYLNDRSLAGYVEKDWFDFILADNPRKSYFNFAPFDPQLLTCDHHTRMIEFLAAAIKKSAAHPKHMLEVGSSLGRTFFEVCQKIRSVESATLVEPSQNLFNTFNKIFQGENITQLSILKGNLEQTEVTLNTAPIKAACAHVNIEHLNKQFQDLAGLSKNFDLTICANVIDQCADHRELVATLKDSVTPGGTLLLSCTYQWNDKYIGNASEIIHDINELFDSSWTFLAETNLPFQVRVYERYWMTFLSHIVVYQSPV